MKDYKMKNSSKTVDYDNDVIERLIDLKVDIDMGDLSHNERADKISLFNKLARGTSIPLYK